jgi:bacillopeptidase F
MGGTLYHPQALTADAWAQVNLHIKALGENGARITRIQIFKNGAVCHDVSDVAWTGSVHLDYQDRLESSFAYYRVKVWQQSANALPNNVPFERAWSSPIWIEQTDTLSAVSLSASPASPRLAGTPITLTEGAHELTATATVPGSGPGTGTTRPSAPVHVTLDTAAPALTVTSPAEGAPQSSRIIQVAGQAVDPHLRGVTVNGTAVTVNADGSFAIEIVGSEGANTETVVATDMAGNQTTVTRHLSTDSQPPSMSNLLPAANATVYTADVVTIAFDSEPGLALAGFQIAVGGLGGTSVTTKPNGTMSLEPGEIALRETRAGHYEAQWTVPAGLSANSAYVRLRAVDAGGNETRMTAPGVLKIVADVRPVAVISGPTTGRVNFLLTFDGRSSTDPDGRIVTYTWDWGDGATSSGSRMFHRWAQPGTYTVRLTVTDNLGATGTATQTVTITR